MTSDKMLQLIKLELERLAEFGTTYTRMEMVASLKTIANLIPEAETNEVCDNE